jgi:hypothetical protein
MRDAKFKAENKKTKSDSARRIALGGCRFALAFLCFLSLAKQRKEVAAGLPPASNHEVATRLLRENRNQR